MYAFRPGCPARHQCLHHHAAAGSSHSVSGKPRQGEAKKVSARCAASPTMLARVSGLMLSIGYYFIIRNMGALSYTEGLRRHLQRCCYHPVASRQDLSCALGWATRSIQGYRQWYLADDFRRYRGPLVQHLQCCHQHFGPCKQRRAAVLHLPAALVLLAWLP